MKIITIVKHFNPNIIDYLDGLSSEDGVLFLQDGVLGLRRGTFWEERLKALIKRKISIFCQKDDINARGIDSLLPGVNPLTYEEVIDVLATFSGKIITLN